MKKTPRPKLPSPETLAQIAATLVAGGQSPDVAAKNALRLWQETCRILDPAHDAELAKVETIVRDTIKKQLDELPAQWPAKLDDFLRLVVHAKTPADATKRFRDFLRERVRQSHVHQRHVWGEASPEDEAEFQGRKKEQEAELARFLKQHPGHFEDKAANLVAKYKRNGLGLKEWQSLTAEYLQWWNGQKTATARANALKRGEASAVKKSVKKRR